MTTFQIPKIMKFTVMPYRLVARAWLDPQFESALVSYPKAFLLEKGTIFPRDCEYLVLRDSPSVKHYILPYLDATCKSMSLEELNKNLIDETGGDETFEEFLPASVISKALTDSNYKSLLIRNPYKAVEAISYNCRHAIRVIENSEKVYHLPLRFNTLKGEDFQAIYSRLRDSNMVIGSTKCCASGTCNDDDRQA